MSTNNTSAKPTPFTVGESSIGEGIINYKSTNNMNTNNNASQTLFRFVSLRNPQLTETKIDNLGFIHRPDISSFFNNQVSETDSALATSFPAFVGINKTEFGEIPVRASGFNE